MSRVMFDIPADQATALMSQDRVTRVAVVRVPYVGSLVASEPHLAAGDRIILRCPELRVMLPGVIAFIDEACETVTTEVD